MAKNKKKAARPEPVKPTLIAFLLDRTGSMDSCKQETIKGFNEYVKGLLKQKDECLFTLTQFDTQGIDVIHDGVALADVKRLDNENYVPRGSTNLYDAMATTIEAAQGKAGSKYKVLFVTLTDGQENASVKFNRESIQDRIKFQEDKHGWTFLHIGVGFEGFEGGQTLMRGTKSFSNAVHITKSKTLKAYGSLCCATNAYRSMAGGQSVNATNSNVFEKMKQEDLDKE